MTDAIEIIQRAYDDAYGGAVETLERIHTKHRERHPNAVVPFSPTKQELAEAIAMAVANALPAFIAAVRISDLSRE